MNFSTLDYLHTVYQQSRPLLAFGVEKAEMFAPWKEKVLQKLWELLGDFPEERCSPDPTITDEWNEDGYIRQRVVFFAEDTVPVPCYVLIPESGSPPYPTLLCLHGHGRGKDDVVGVVYTEEDTMRIRRLNYDYARQCVRRGYLCVCPDIRCFGERAEPDGSGCRHAFLNALLIGRQLKGMQIWDVLRTVDYALSRDDVDRGRLGCIGLSMGGELTIYAAILDDRIRCAVSSGFVRVFKPEVYSRQHCPCSYVSGLLKWFDLDDLACAIAPTPLLLEIGRGDTNTPFEMACQASQKVQRCYEVLGIPERVDVDTFDGGHEFSGQKAFDWFDDWLRGRKG